jgi:hypothetical protein
MDIDQHVNQIVQNIVADITAKVQQQAASAIESKIAEVIAAIDATSILGQQLSQKIDERLAQLPINANAIESELSSRVNKLATNLATTVQTRSMELVNEIIQTQINSINFQDLCQSSLITAIQGNKFNFPSNSIPADAVQTDNLKLSGNNVNGGIISNFGSTGIDDKSTGCQLSIFDDVTVIENNLLTRDLTVKGKTTIEGDLVVTGQVPESSPMYINLVDSVSKTVKSSLNQVIFDGYADKVFAQIREHGIDVTKLKVNGQEVVNGSNLSNNITFSNLQRVGTLGELRVSGESLLSQTLYTTSKRIGINTTEPAQPLSIWDQEIEIGFGKKETNVALIEVPRSNQQLLISVNNKNNLILLSDGSATVERLNIGATSLSSASMPPSYDAPHGSIVFNSSPTLGGPLGWVSLGGARWANFGFVD